MDNDTLINQARRLYAVLHVKQYALSIDNKAEFDRHDHLVMRAYCRYQRRLNRCVLCYQYRLTDCRREFEGIKRRFCPNLTYRPHKPDAATADAVKEKP